MERPCVGCENMHERISRRCIFYHFTTVKVGLCLTISRSKKKNEYSTCIEILHPSLVKGHILTSDAGIAYKGWCATIHALGGYYEIPIKGNHPAVRKKLSDFFQNDGIDREEFQYHKEIDKG